MLPKLAHVPEVSVEEFIEGEDFTFDTICVDGRIEHYSIAFYRPRALQSRTLEWVSPQTIVVRDPDDPTFRQGKEMGEAVLKALGFRTGFTHMEWFRKPSGEAVFGEIAARASRRAPRRPHQLRRGRGRGTPGGPRPSVTAGSPRASSAATTRPGS